jgi:hypothetical protein
MNFKKDYINYVLHTVIQNEFYGVRDDVRIRKILEKIISIPEVANAAFLTGKTAGLEILFKYLLYISDKIDKSQITIFNLKDNFEYDIQNLKKICEEIKNFRNEIPKPEEEAETEENKEAREVSVEDYENQKESDTAESETLIEDESETISEETENEKPETKDDTKAEEDIVQEETEEKQEFILIKNQENEVSDEEVFGLAGITRSVEMEEEAGAITDNQENIVNDDTETDDTVSDFGEESIKETEYTYESTEEELETGEDEILTASDIEKINKYKHSEKDEFEIEIKNSAENEELHDDDVKEGSVTSEVYYRFENKFFEEVKILEKLFTNAEKACRGKPLEKQSEKMLQSFPEIIEISSELSSLTRQLSLDLTADIFFTINLLFAKALNNPSLITPERTKLLKASLLLVTSLIKGEDYLGYDELVKKIESLRDELRKPQDTSAKGGEEKPKVKDTPEEAVKKPEIEPPVTEIVPEEAIPEEPEKKESEQEEIKIKNSLEIETPEKSPAEKIESADYPKEIVEKPQVESYEQESRKTDTALFKMKYLVKEFEKNFVNIIDFEHERSKFEILDEIDNLNNLLRMLAKTSSSVKNTDVLKLSEVSYVFLKYLKDYRMNLLDAEIQQIIKYIIFTYKMLLTDRKPEDFEILVQYLNNPVKIFTDT